MKVEKGPHNFEIINHSNTGNKSRLVQQSSAIGPHYEDALKCPGTSFLWIGNDYESQHLDREEVAELVKHLQAWLKTGSLKLKKKK